jgi:hypothetical protein
MLHLPKYKERWEQKLKWYDKHFQNQLLITYESENLTIDAQNVINEIKKYKNNLKIYISDI